jgi:membrane-associated phospholipid phosphatase
MHKLFRNRVYPVDWIVLSYCLMMVAFVLILGRPLEKYADELLFYSGVAALVVLIVRFLGEGRSPLTRFFRLLYPAILFTAFYRTTGGLMFLLHDRFLDYQLTAFEQSILGFEPSLFIDKYLLNPWLTEIFMGTYFSYYLMLPCFLLPLFFMKRYDLLRQSLASISLTFFAGYTLFFIYPVEGPRWHYMDRYLHRVDGPLFRQLVEFVQAAGSVRGGCMPSTHVAVALVIMIYTYRMSKPLGWLLAPVIIGMAIGTIWGRYHYTSDVLVGVVIALVAIWLVDRYHPKYESMSAARSDNHQVRVQNVS